MKIYPFLKLPEKVSYWRCCRGNGVPEGMGQTEPLKLRNDKWANTTREGIHGRGVGAGAEQIDCSQARW